MDHKEPGRAPLIVPTFARPADRHFVWRNFTSHRLDTIVSYHACQSAAQRGEPSAIKQWEEWLMFVATARLKGEC